MPTPDLIQGVNLPTYDDPAAIPDDLANVFYANLSRGIPRFSTTAQRDAAYPSPTDGQHCWITAENAVYVRSGGAWRRVWRQGGHAHGYAYLPLGTSGVATLGFGTTLAAAPASVQVTPAVTASSLAFYAGVISESVTATGCQVRFVYHDGTPMTGSRGIYWTADV